MLSMSKLPKRKTQPISKLKKPSQLCDLPTDHSRGRKFPANEPEKKSETKLAITMDDKTRLRQLKDDRRSARNQNIVPTIIKRPNQLPNPPAYKRNCPAQLRHIIRPDDWCGHRCFIIGGGKSLDGFDWGLLNGELTIGINRAFEAFSPSINISMDEELFGHFENGYFGEESKNKWNEYKGTRVFRTRGAYIYPPRDEEHPYDIYTVESSPAFAKGDLKALCARNNTGFLALHLAITLGANPIYLLGFDMKGDGKGKQAWWHDGYKDKQQGENVYKTFIKNFNNASAKIVSMGIEVINLNPKSKLHCFNKMDPRKVLNKKPRTPIIVSFYTENSSYETEARRLMQSLHLFGLEYDIQPLKNKGNWKLNTDYKPKYILEMMNKHKGRDIVWLDADSGVLKYPELFVNANYDIGYVKVNWSNYSRPGKSQETLSGTLFIKNNTKMIDLVKDWIDKLKKNPKSVDQVALRQVLPNHKKVKVKLLPDTYCQIFDTMSSAGDPVIEQYQASRRLKQEVNNVS